MEGKPVQDKRTIYVGAYAAHCPLLPACTQTFWKVTWTGGLEESVTEDIIRAAMVPFGEIIDVNLPLDSSSRAPLHALLVAPALHASLANR